MNLATLIPLAFTEATGRPWSGNADATNSNWPRMLGYVQIVLNDWARENGGNEWESNYNPGINCGTITATDTFNISSAGFLTVTNKAHDYIYIVSSDGVMISEYKTVPGPQLKRYRIGHRAVMVQGVKNVIFSQPFTTASNEYGGTLYVPGYQAPAVPVNPTDIVECDDPYYIIYMAAQEWAQPDVTLVQNVPSLVSKATNSMTNMRLANQRLKDSGPQTPLEGAGRGETWL